MAEEAGESREGEEHSPEEREELQPEERDRRAREEVHQALLAGNIHRVHKLPPTKDELERYHLQQDLELKERYGNRLLRLVTVQLVIADIVFVLYFIIGVHWDLPEGVIYVWLVTTLVELVGVATVVTRYLFPRRDSVVTQSE
jgi:hypothetical protein